MCDTLQQTLTTTGKEGTILQLYLSYHNTYVTKYGEKTAILCQVGDFFEIYAVINEKEEKGPNIYRLADMLGIQVTRRNKSNIEVNDTNYLMSGFPIGGIQKHIQTLVSNCYTVVVIRQVTPPPNVRREVTEIISPSMTLSPSSQDANYIVVLMLSFTNGLWSCGVAAADVSTGLSLVYETSSTKEDPTYAMDETVRILNTYPSREIVLLGNIPINMRECAMDMIGVSHRPIGVHQIWENYPSGFRKKEYQEAVLSKAGIGKGIISNHILTGIDGMSLVSIALPYMIQFAYEHNQKLVSRLQTPTNIANHGRLLLQYNSAQQLNIVSTGLPGEVPLLSILNRTATSPGSRLFRDRLLNPITSKIILQDRYNQVDYYMKDQLYQKVRKSLCGILDLERIARRMVSETQNPCDWVSFHLSLSAGNSVAKMLSKLELSNLIKDVMDGYEQFLDLEEASKYSLGDIRGNIFKKGVHKDIDELTTTIQEKLDELGNIAKYLSNGEDTRLCKVDCNDRDGYFLTTTKKRWSVVTNFLNNKEIKIFTAKQISHGSNTLRITSDDIINASDIIIRSQSRLSIIVQERYLSFLNHFVEIHVLKIEKIAYELADIDVHSTNAMNAHEYAYIMPVISPESASFVYTKMLRHPIIERIQHKIDYIANNIYLNSDNDSEDENKSATGLLLYGVNASGKSSLMKAIGLAIIMAQSGMYVSSTYFRFSPYTNIFTRISGNDNLYQGLSSFAVEMTELRNILVRADSSSLVLGDELCSGTEAISAVSIVASGIDLLLRKKSTFVFATHLHELMDIPEIAEQMQCGKLKVSHMHTEVKDGCIVYDRTLRDGPGESSYGIEVCRGLGMPSGFMTLAEKIRRYVTGQNDGFVHQKQSRYNSSVFMDMCGVCQTTRATDTHHIRYQETADKNGFIQETHTHIHKNIASNLVPLCSSCHMKEHNGSLKIHGWKQTSNGIELDYTINTQNIKIKTQLDTQDDTQIIKQAPQNAAKNMEELIHVWKPYLRYTRHGWMMRKKDTLRTKFKAVEEEKLINMLTTISNIPTCLVPDHRDLEMLQSALLDVSL